MNHLENTKDYRFIQNSFIDCLSVYCYFSILFRDRFKKTLKGFLTHEYIQYIGYFDSLNFSVLKYSQSIEKFNILSIGIFPVH